MISKTIIISSPENSGRGILTLQIEDDILSIRIRLYNINKLNKTTKIGIYHGGQVYSANLLEKNGSYTSSMVGNFDINQDFYAALIDTVDNHVILSGGTYAGYYFNDNSVFSNIENLENSTPQKEYSYNEECCDKCSNCKYKEFFYNSNKLTQATDFEPEENENIEEKSENIENNYIFQSILPQFQYIFENYNADEQLNNLIPESKFVKITENGEEYSIGAIYEQEEIKYICYAVKANYNTPAPEELGENYQWLPIEKEDPLSEGFYIVFQDAKDLKILKL